MKDATVDAQFNALGERLEATQIPENALKVTGYLLAMCEIRRRGKRTWRRATAD